MRNIQLLREIQTSNVAKHVSASFKIPKKLINSKSIAKVNNLDLMGFSLEKWSNKKHYSTETISSKMKKENISLNKWNISFEAMRLDHFGLNRRIPESNNSIKKNNCIKYNKDTIKTKNLKTYSSKHLTKLTKKNALTLYNINSFPSNAEDMHKIRFLKLVENLKSTEKINKDKNVLKEQVQFKQLVKKKIKNMRTYPSEQTNVDNDTEITCPNCDSKMKIVPFKKHKVENIDIDHIRESKNDLNLVHQKNENQNNEGMSVLNRNFNGAERVNQKYVDFVIEGYNSYEDAQPFVSLPVFTKNSAENIHDTQNEHEIANSKDFLCSTNKILQSEKDSQVDNFSNNEISEFSENKTFSDDQQRFCGNIDDNDDICEFTEKKTLPSNQQLENIDTNCELSVNGTFSTDKQFVSTNIDIEKDESSEQLECCNLENELLEPSEKNNIFEVHKCDCHTPLKSNNAGDAKEVSTTQATEISRKKWSKGSKLDAHIISENRFNKINFGTKIQLNLKKNCITDKQELDSENVKIRLSDFKE
ncbi:hypothetical protein HELRODRAFT_164371 [Helobdella robusta]|uniref:Uncharacterized protein n=1 Tax=Helobdella robusta TaxID=6412 RepID=T1EVB9_HELRO|nr:hypothetical protein HELRODRAFT_164371 [Helobdella robusta]ESN94515.1 hypothetical protein HELRODRAFT_164371 [Helobdella robusta]